MNDVNAQHRETIGPLTVSLNGETVATRARTLGELLVEREATGARVATAVNGRFVPERQRSTTRLEPGDAIEIVSARQGG